MRKHGTVFMCIVPHAVFYREDGEETGRRVRLSCVVCSTCVCPRRLKKLVASGDKSVPLATSVPPIEW